MSNEKKYASLSTLQTFLDNLRNTFSALSHKHTISDITDYTVDSALSSTSTNPVQNKVLDAEFDAIAESMNALDLAIDGKSDSDHTHDDRYYTESEVDSKISAVNTSITNITSGSVTVAKAEEADHATSADTADEATHATTADSATTATSATTAASCTGNAATATKATQDASGNVITSTYETKSDASAKLTEAKSYTDTAISNLINSAPTTLDTLGEIATAMEENADVVEALNTAIGTKADAEHDHTMSDITDLAEVTQTNTGLISAEDKIQLDYGGVPIASTSGTGAAYTVTIDGINELKTGTKITIIPHTNSTTNTATLNVNGLGAKMIRQRLTTSTTTTALAHINNWLISGKPITLMYNGTYWVTEFARPDANTIYGTVPIENGGTDATTVESARENLGVYSKEDHDWTLLYDSGEITDSVNAFANIDISDYRKFMVAVKCVNDGTNSSTKNGAVTFTATDGTTYQFSIWSSLFLTSTDTSGGFAKFESIDGWLVATNSARSIRATTFLGDSEGGTADNLANTPNAIMKCTKTLSNMMISATDQNTSYFFLAGSRAMVWGCNA